MPVAVPPPPPPPPPVSALHTLATISTNRGVAMWDRPGGNLLFRMGPRTAWNTRKTYWVREIRDGWGSVQDPLTGNRRRLWIKLDPRYLDIHGTNYEIEIDRSDRVLRLRYGGRVVVRARVSVGRPANPTPLGNYQITDRVRGGRVYGCCVVALSAVQRKLPQGWQGGGRVAIHGPLGAPLGKALSSGCVRIGERTLRRLYTRVPIGTPVRIRA